MRYPKRYNEREKFGIYYNKELGLTSNDRSFSKLDEMIQKAVTDWYADYEFKTKTEILEEEKITSETIFMSIAQLGEGLTSLPRKNI
jgi:hypothetical protein